MNITDHLKRTIMLPTPAFQLAIYKIAYKRCLFPSLSNEIFKSAKGKQMNRLFSIFQKPKAAVVGVPFGRKGF